MVLYTIYTNGRLIDEKICQRFVEVGNVIPAISLEGFKEETDKRRGPEHFDRVMKAMDLTKRGTNLIWLFCNVDTTQCRTLEW